MRHGGLRIRLRKGAGVVGGSRKVRESPERKAEPAVVDENAGLVDVSTPVTGVFYRAPIRVESHSYRKAIPFTKARSLALSKR